MPQDKNKEVDLGGVTLVMFEYQDKSTGEKIDFKVTKEELQNLNSPFFGNQYKRDEAVETLLKTADLNHDGAISSSEFAKLALAIREKLPKQFKSSLRGVGDDDQRRENEFSLADAMSRLQVSSGTITMDDVRAQNATGVSVISNGKPR